MMIKAVLNEAKLWKQAYCKSPFFFILPFKHKLTRDWFVLHGHRIPGKYEYSEP